MSDRGAYRSISVVLARGKDFRALSPAAKVVFYTLKLELGPSGIDVYDLELLPKYTGLTETEATAACLELRERLWMDWEDNVVWIIRGLQFEPALNPANKKHRAGLLAHVRGLPRLAIVGRFILANREWFEDADSLSNGYPKAIDSHSIQGKGKGRGKREKGILAADAAERPSGESEPAEPPPEAPALPPLEARAGNWVSEGAAWYRTTVGAITEPRFGGQVKPLVDTHGWPATFAGLQAWEVATRSRGARKLAWFCEDAVRYIAPPEAPPLLTGPELDANGWMTDEVERLTRPAGYVPWTPRRVA